MPFLYKIENRVIMPTLTRDNLFMGMPIFTYGQGKRAVPLRHIKGMPIPLACS